MVDDFAVVLVLLGCYYQQGKTLGDIIEINGASFRLVFSNAPIKDEPGVNTFRVDPIAILLEYLKRVEDEKKV